MAPDAVNPTAAATARRRRQTALGTGALLAGAMVYTGVADPHNRAALFPPCPFKMLTGWNCPACGGLRMTHDLLHGHIATAVVDNIYLLVGIPALLAWLVFCRYTGKPVATKPMYAVIVISAIAWTVLRNLPGFPLVPTVYGR